MSSFPVYGFADPHLGISTGFNMDRFSAHWDGHPGTLLRAWAQTVPENGIVLVPGDLSVATKREDILTDYRYLDGLPGELKVLSPGNHDRAIWDTQGKARSALTDLPSLTALKGQAMRLSVHDGQLRASDTPADLDTPGLVLAAVCGSLSPQDNWFNRNAKADDDKRYPKEVRRLTLALNRARELRGPQDKLAVMIHYPPFANGNDRNEFTDLIENAGADLCVFGHVHMDEQWASMFQGTQHGCTYALLAADYLTMTPRALGSLDASGFQVDVESR